MSGSNRGNLDIVFASYFRLSKHSVYTKSGASRWRGGTVYRMATALHRPIHLFLLIRNHQFDTGRALVGC